MSDPLVPENGEKPDSSLKLKAIAGMMNQYNTDGVKFTAEGSQITAQLRSDQVAQVQQALAEGTPASEELKKRGISVSIDDNNKLTINGAENLSVRDMALMAAGIGSTDVQSALAGGDIKKAVAAADQRATSGELFGKQAESPPSLATPPFLPSEAAATDAPVVGKIDFAALAGKLGLKLPEKRETPESGSPTSALPTPAAEITSEKQRSV